MLYHENTMMDVIIHVYFQAGISGVSCRMALICGCVSAEKKRQRPMQLYYSRNTGGKKRG